MILRGAGERQFAFKLRRMREAKAMSFPGVIADLEESFRHTDSDGFRARLNTTGGRKVLAARRARGRKRLSA